MSMRSGKTGNEPTADKTPPAERDAGITRLTLQPTDARASRAIDPDDDGTRGETSVGKFIKSLRQGLFGVLFVMSKDFPEGNKTIQLLLILIDCFQVCVAPACLPYRPFLLDQRIESVYLVA